MKAVILFLSLLCIIKSTDACKCVVRDTSKPSFLCKNDYVLRGEATNEILTGNMSDLMRDRIYTVKVQQVYKGSDKINTNISSVVDITTPEQSATCGVQMPLNKDLVISGSINGMEIGMNRCGSWYKEYKDVSSDFRTFISDMKTHCDDSSPTDDAASGAATVALLQVLTYLLVPLVYIEII